MPMLPKELRCVSRGGGGQPPHARSGRRGSLFPSHVSQVEQSEQGACTMSRHGSARWTQAGPSEVSRSIAGSVASGSDVWSVTGKLSEEGSHESDGGSSCSSEGSASASMAPAGGANTVDVFARLASVADSQRMRLVDIFRMVRPTPQMWKLPNCACATWSSVAYR